MKEITLSCFKETAPAPRNAIVVLNQLIPQNFITSIKSCDLLVLADGASNRIVEMLQTSSPADNGVIWGNLTRLGDCGKFFHVGDMDSSRIEAEQYLMRNRTDFEKALDTVRQECSMRDLELLVFGCLGGRFDHTIGSVHILTKLQTEHPDLNIVAYSETGHLVGLSGPTRIEVAGINEYKEASEQDDVYCGYFAFDSRAITVTTTGFKYDASDQSFAFGVSWLSTSNVIASEVVTFEKYEGPAGFLFIQFAATEQHLKHAT